MEIQENMCANAIRKVAILITKAADIGMNLSSYGHAAENDSNGNVYLWLEDYNFTLYVPLCCGDDSVIKACWSNLYVDEEETIDADTLTLRELEAWADDLTQRADEAQEVAA